MERLYSNDHRNARTWQDFFGSPESIGSEDPLTMDPSASPSLNAILTYSTEPSMAPSPVAITLPPINSPPSNDSNKNSAINNTLTILILLSIIFCFIWAPTFIRRCDPRSQRRRREAEALRAAGEAAIRAMESGFGDDSHLPHGMTLEERREFVQNVLMTTKLLEKPASSSTRQKSNTDSSKENTQTAIDNNATNDTTIQCSKASPSRMPDTDTCAICLLEYETDDEICWSQNPLCNHAFHKDCMMEWLLRHEECPCCRNVYIPLDDSTSQSQSQSRRSASDYFPRFFLLTTTTRSNVRNHSNSNTTTTALVEMTPHSNNNTSLQSATSESQLSRASLLSIEHLLHRLSTPGSRLRGDGPPTLEDLLSERNDSIRVIPSTETESPVQTNRENNTLQSTAVEDNSSLTNQTNEEELSVTDTNTSNYNESLKQPKTENFEEARDDNSDSSPIFISPGDDFSSDTEKLMNEHSTDESGGLLASNIDIESQNSTPQTPQDLVIDSAMLEKMNYTNASKSCGTESDTDQKATHLESNIVSISNHIPTIESCDTECSIDQQVSKDAEAVMSSEPMPNNASIIAHDTVNDGDINEDRSLKPDPKNSNDAMVDEAVCKPPPV